MPRAKSSVNLSTDDLRQIVSRDLGEELITKLVNWAKGELARREAAGRARQPKVEETLTYEEGDMAIIYLTQ